MTLTYVVFSLPFQQVKFIKGQFLLETPHRKLLLSGEKEAEFALYFHRPNNPLDLLIHINSKEKTVLVSRQFSTLRTKQVFPLSSLHIYFNTLGTDKSQYFVMSHPV